MARLKPCSKGVNHEPSKKRWARWIPGLKGAVPKAFNQLLPDIFLLVRGTWKPSHPVTNNPSSPTNCVTAASSTSVAFSSTKRPWDLLANNTLSQKRPIFNTLPEKAKLKGRPLDPMWAKTKWP